MHFKLDENADPRWRLPLEHAGRFVSTISEEGLSGSDDDIIAKVCCKSGSRSRNISRQIQRWQLSRRLGIIVRLERAK